MKVDKIYTITSYVMEVSDSEYEYYIRYSEDVWYFRIGESEEPVLDQEKAKELEDLFQKNFNAE